MYRYLLTISSMGLLWGAVLAYSILPVFAEDEQESTKATIVRQIIHFIKGKNVRLGNDTLTRMANAVYEESRLYELDYRLVLAVIKVESNFRHDAVSHRGAHGLMQVKPALAKFIAKGAGVPYKGSGCLSEPEKNIRLGVYHLSNLMEDFQDLGVALHAYNTGPAKAKIGVQNRVSKEKGPTNRFAKHVLKEYRKNIEVLPDVE